MVTCPLPRACHTPIQFLFVATRLWIGLPSDPASRRRPALSSLRSANTLAPGLHLTSSVPCRHTRPGMSRACNRVGSMPWFGGSSQQR